VWYGEIEGFVVVVVWVLLGHFVTLCILVGAQSSKGLLELVNEGGMEIVFEV
jgi:hypothetical protein